MGSDRAEERRKQVLIAMQDRTPGSAQFLVRALDDDDALVREWAIEAITRRRKDTQVEAVPHLLDRLDDQRADVRWYAARTLGKLGDDCEAICSALVRLLCDPDEFVRCFSALALGNLRCHGAMAALAKMHRRSNLTLREKVSVGTALARINTLPAASSEETQGSLFPEPAMADLPRDLPLTKGEVLKKETEAMAERVARDRIGGDIVVNGRIRLSYQYARNVSLKERVLEERGRACQLCGFTFEKKDGTKYAECHHLKPVSAGGTDEPDNLLVVCPNHHRQLEQGKHVAFPEGMKRPKVIVLAGEELTVRWPPSE